MSQEMKGIKRGQPIPLFNLRDSDGNEHSVQEWVGKPFLLYILRGTWCPNCRKQLRQLKQNANSFSDLDLPIIIIVGQRREAVRKWLGDHPMPFPFLIDETREVIKAFDVYHPFGLDALNIAYPSTFLVDSNGRVDFAYVGKKQSDRPSFEQTYHRVLNLLDLTYSDL